VDRVQELINEDPGRSTRKLAEDLKVSKFLIRKIVKEEISYLSYSLHRGQFMMKATKKTRYEKVTALVNCLKHPPAPDILIFLT
jgi:hypothetical protein